MEKLQLNSTAQTDTSILYKSERSENAVLQTWEIWLWFFMYVVFLSGFFE